MKLQEIARCYFEELQKQSIPRKMEIIKPLSKGTLALFEREGRLTLGFILEVFEDDIKFIWMSEQTWLASERDYFIPEKNSPFGLPLLCCSWLILWGKKSDVLCQLGAVETGTLTNIEAFLSNKEIKVDVIEPYVHVTAIGEETITYPSRLLTQSIKPGEERVSVQSGPWILSQDDPRDWLQKQIKEYFSVFQKQPLWYWSEGELYIETNKVLLAAQTSEEEIEVEYIFQSKSQSDFWIQIEKSVDGGLYFFLPAEILVAHNEQNIEQNLARLKKRNRLVVLQIGHWKFQKGEEHFQLSVTSKE